MEKSEVFTFWCQAGRCLLPWYALTRAFAQQAAGNILVHGGPDSTLSFGPLARWEPVWRWQLWGGLPVAARGDLALLHTLRLVALLPRHRKQLFSALEEGFKRSPENFENKWVLGLGIGEICGLALGKRHSPGKAVGRRSLDGEGEGTPC